VSRSNVHTHTNTHVLMHNHTFEQYSLCGHGRTIYIIFLILSFYVVVSQPKMSSFVGKQLECKHFQYTLMQKYIFFLFSLPLSSIFPSQRPRRVRFALFSQICSLARSQRFSSFFSLSVALSPFHSLFLLFSLAHSLSRLFCFPPFHFLSLV